MALPNWKFRCLRVLAAATLLLVGQATVGEAQTTYTVCATGACDFITINSAIAGASAGDTLDLGAETFTEEVVVDKDLSLVGSGAVSTILVSGIDTVVTVDAGVVASLSRLTIGGGMADEGGGIHNSGTLTVTGVIIDDNFAWMRGGGIWTEGDLTLDRVLVVDNGVDPKPAPDGAGGGIYASGNIDVVIRNSIIDNNAAREGGGVYSKAFTTILRTSIINNWVTDFTNTGGGGGGIAVQVSSGYTDVRNSTISGNTSQNLGGGIINTDTIVLSNTTVSGNVALGLTDVLGRAGGGIYNTTLGDVTLNNVTLTDNEAGGFGAGIYNDADVFGTSGTVTMRNSIIADQRLGGANCYGNFAPIFTSAGWNIDSDASCNLVAVGDLPGLALNLAPLADYGGPTETHNIDFLSVAVDAGDPAGCQADVDGDGVLDGVINADQRGQIRVDSPASVGGPCDIGAVESNMVLNGMLEDDKDGNRQADLWTGMGFQNFDRQVCRRRVANNGSCAVRMKGKGGNAAKTFFQTHTRIGTANNIYEAVAYVATRNAPPGSLDLVVRFDDAFGFVEEFTTSIPTGDHNYVPVVLNVTTTAVHTMISVAVRSTMSPAGRLFVDDISLTR